MDPCELVQLEQSGLTAKVVSGQLIRHTCSTYKEHSVDIVDVAVLPAAVMDVIPRHTDFGAVENGRLQTQT